MKTERSGREPSWFGAGVIRLDASGWEVGWVGVPDDGHPKGRTLVYWRRIHCTADSATI